MTITSDLCHAITSVTPASLTPDLVATGKRLVLDGLAVGVAGARIEKAPAIFLEHLTEQGGKPIASVLGLGIKLPPVAAALVNAASIHVLDYEPMWLPSTHALSPALAAALAATEATGKGGLDLLTAVIKGIEVQGWILQAQGNVSSKDFKFHPPGAVGPIGATVAAGHILGLDADTLAMAIGIAGSRCGGLFTNSGTMTKASHCGYAASLGLESAMLAARGFTASRAIFDATHQSYGQGLLAATFDPKVLLGYGKTFRVLDPGFAIKLYPAKFTTHYAICAALAARAKLPKGAAIKSVHMTAAIVPSADRPKPQTGLEGKFSVQYTAAAALLDGHVDMATFTDRRLAETDIQELLARITLTMSPDIPSKYTAGRYLDIDVELADGSHVIERCSAPAGAWGTPPVSPAQHEAKVRDCLATAFDAARIEDILARMATLERLDGTGLSVLLAELRG